MKKYDILDRLGSIDAEFIMEAEEAVEAANQRKFHKKRIITVLAAAACVCLMIPFGIFMRSVWSGPASEPGVTTGTDDPLPNDNIFVIEDGRLLAYTGVETDVVLPDEVTEITAEAFEKSPAASEIETIRLGASVSQIDTAAFTGLSSLKNIDVSKENKFFYFADGILCSTDGTLVFTLASEMSEEEMERAVRSLIDKILTGSVPSELVTRIVVGSAVIDVDIRDHENPYFPYRLFVTAIHAYGKTVEFEDPLELQYTLYGMQIYDYEGHFIFNYTFPMNIDGHFGGKLRILGRDGVFSYDSAATAEEYDIRREDGVYGYNSSRFYFEMNDDGQLCYSRTPIKFTGLAVSYEYFNRAVARDEFNHEKGILEFGKLGEPLFTPDSTETLEEGLDLDYYFEHEIKSPWRELPSPDIKNIDDYFAYNAERYEAAK